MINNKYSDLAHKITQRYIGKKGVLGIIWIGSATFGVEDEFVDIDIRLLIDRNEKYSPMEQFNEADIAVEVDEMSLDWLLQDTNFDSERNWIRSQAIILFDPNNKMRTEFDKVNNISKLGKEKLLWSVYKEIFNKYDIEKCLKRNQLVAAYVLLSKTINELTKFIFLINDQPVPTLKWRWDLIKNQNLFDITLIENMVPSGLNSLEDKLVVLSDIQNICQDMMIEKGYPKEQVLEPWKY
jgi:hypothetical protein